MRIGIITYYRVPNFGANLQALSTYKYLQNNGHDPIMIQYMSHKQYHYSNTCDDKNIQKKAHLEFCDKYFHKQTNVCYSVENVNSAIDEYQIEALIIGSDAVLQHHPLFSRIKRGKRKPFYILPCDNDRLFPSVFWGVGLKPEIKKSLMSVSSQGSKFSLFNPWLKYRMRKSLNGFSHITVRDEWTSQMVDSITGIKPDVTPDPVFAFNYNCRDIIPSEESIIKRFNIPSKYILISFSKQFLRMETLVELKRKMMQIGLACVALPQPLGINFRHPFDYEIPCPLNPLDWYSLIKYSHGYIGNNMHPIVVCLHNAVPCYSLDTWVNTNFNNIIIEDHSSKVEHILNTFGLQDNRCPVINGTCYINVDDLIKGIVNFNAVPVVQKSLQMYERYEKMMQEIISKFL